MDEILYELRDHASGLNAGRWDYLFSIIKYFRDSGPEFVLPDRGLIGMPTPFMRAYAELLVQTCHRRGAFAIGGMSAFIPSRKDKEANERAFAKVREDKQREASQGFDGSWVAHPDLVPVCQEVFDGILGDRPNQLDVLRDDVRVTAEDLLDIASAEGEITRAGLTGNVEVAARYLEAWLGGLGAVGIHNLMEDAATAEISRSQIWQWVHNGSTLDDGTLITAELVRDVMEQEHGKIRAELGDGYDDRNFETAFRVLEQVALADDYVDFLTLPGVRGGLGMSTATSAGVSSLADTLDEQLAAADAALAEHYPGDRGVRQPVHTVYVPADRYTAATVARLGTPGARGARRARRHAGAARRRGGYAGRGHLGRVPPGAPEARDRADRGPADRLRGRVRQPPGRRGGRRGRRRRQGPRPSRSTTGTPRRSTGSGSSRSRRPPVGVACAPSTCSSASWSARAGSPTASCSPCPR